MQETHPDEITISKKTYLHLLEKAEILASLEAAGVDNWDGYGYAQEIREDWEREDNQ